MPSSVAARLCPNLIFVPGRMDEYKKASAEVFEIFSRYTNLIEQVSIDEAFLDVTDVWRDYGYAMEIAKLIKEDVRREVGLIISAGVSYNKFLAKVASDLLDSCRAVMPVDGARHGLTYLPGPGGGILIARYLGDGSEAARSWFAALWQILRPACCGRPAQPPRIWNT